MALYIGNEKIKINLDGIMYRLNLGAAVIEGAFLVSLDDFILKDSNELYLTVKEDD